MKRPLPSILTQADWAANKGKIAKTLGETGIGAQLKLVEQTYYRIKWALFDAKEIQKAIKIINEVDGAVHEAKKHINEVVEPHRKALAALHDIASKTAAAYGKNPIVPKSSTQHVAEMAKVADALSRQLGELDTDVAAIAKLKANFSSANVDDLLGAKFWADLQKVTWFDAPEIKRFSRDPTFATSIANGMPEKELLRMQGAAQDRIREVAAGYAAVLKFKGTTIKGGDVKARIILPLRRANESLGLKGPAGAGEFGGMRGILNAWQAHHAKAAKSATSPSQQSLYKSMVREAAIIADVLGKSAAFVDAVDKRLHEVEKSLG